MKEELLKIEKEIHEEYYRLFNKMDDVIADGYDAEAKALAYQAKGVLFAIKVLKRKIEELN